MSADPFNALDEAYTAASRAADATLAAALAHHDTQLAADLADADSDPDTASERRTAILAAYAATVAPAQAEHGRACADAAEVRDRAKAKVSAEHDAIYATSDKARDAATDAKRQKLLAGTATPAEIQSTLASLI